ncbi:hypothetical protein G647_07736 [Cladophialophora carrionii CBS 160.54]|uniref:ASTRA-associated protein 1 n=1 Tax=Cladophialophora carrionii CBS 160.54 TaxID=1279043 RepID=V9D3C6_9EURO|nr:uncharacterized protein G647_07736 [Cladophialophora carrionii CBS 160.54]ETI21389.1 hypothetical protein G647_07736 [Cladophialophora carrionii CBS 160.54]
MEQGPAVPAYILRGHEAPVHALHFYADNSFLASGDSDGWMVLWSLSSKRPVAVWKAHEAGILQIQHWTKDRLISHGRDHKLRVWQVRPETLASLSRKLPAEAAISASDLPQPWLLHSFSVSALNFCAFSTCNEDTAGEAAGEVPSQLIASPNGLDSGGIDIFQLPSEKRVSQIGSDKNDPTGMVMAVSLWHQRDEPSSRLVLAAGYEDGRVTVHVHQGDLDGSARAAGQTWKRVLIAKPHIQPVLSVKILPTQSQFLTSSADASIAKFSVPTLSETAVHETRPDKAVNTKHAGQQGLSIRSDGRIFATAGWDGRVRVYSYRTMKELAVLKWHKVGVYSTAFADVSSEDDVDVSNGSEELTSSPKSTPPTPAPGISRPMSALDLIKQKREDKARRIHWLAAGGKDGKISLWDIY